MKMMIQMVLVALVVGGMSAGGSFYYQKLNPKPNPVDADSMSKTDARPENADGPVNADGEVASSETPMTETPANVVAMAPADKTTTEKTKIETPEQKNEIDAPKTSSIATPSISFGPPVAVRPPFDPNGDEAGDLIYKLRVRMASTSRQERRIAEREEAMKLIVDDLRAEQSKAVQMRKRILEEQSQSLHIIDEARRAVDVERELIHDDLAETRRLADEKVQSVMREKEESMRMADDAMNAARKEQEELRRQLDEFRKPAEVRDRSGSPEETANLKKMVGVLDSMPPESTAKILEDLVKKGRTEAVVAILNGMKPRVSAKVLTAVSESQPALAADLVERLKRLKKDAEPPVAPAK